MIRIPPATPPTAAPAIAPVDIEVESLVPDGVEVAVIAVVAEAPAVVVAVVDAAVAVANVVASVELVDDVEQDEVLTVAAQKISEASAVAVVGVHSRAIPFELSRYVPFCPDWQHHPPLSSFPSTPQRVQSELGHYDENVGSALLPCSRSWIAVALTLGYFNAKSLQSEGSIDLGSGSC